MHPFLISQVENHKGVSRKALLESFDGCARLRPIWDAFSRQYDAVIVPSAQDEAPEGTEYTGDAVRTSFLLPSYSYSNYY
jgi:hypothetical protein